MKPQEFLYRAPSDPPGLPVCGPGQTTQGAWGLGTPCSNGQCSARPHGRVLQPHRHGHLLLPWT